MIDPLCLESRILEACRPGAVPAQQPVPEAAVPIADEVHAKAEGRGVPVDGQASVLESAPVCEPTPPAVPFGPPVVQGGGGAMIDADGNRIIGPTIWSDDGCCGVCGYLPKRGNRRTPSSQRNWIRFCRVRHEAKHQRPTPPEKTDSGRDRKRWERYQSRDVNGLFELENLIPEGCRAHREEYELTRDFPGMPDPPTTPCVGGCPACGYSMLGFRKTFRDRSVASGVEWANYEHPTFTRADVEHAQRLSRMSRGAGLAEVTDRAPRSLDEWADRMVEEARARMGRGGR